MASGRTLGMRIKRARERLRMTQQQLADAIGVTQKTIDNWEHDKTIPRSAIGALEHVLGVDLSQPELPPPDLILKYGHIPQVRAIWSIPDEEMGELERLGVIRLCLREHPEWLQQYPAPDHGPRRETA